MSFVLNVFLIEVFYFCPSESLGEPFSLETSTQPGVTDGSSLISFSINPTSSSTCSHTTAILEASSEPTQRSSTQASTCASITATVTSTQPTPFIQISDAPQAPVQALNQVTPQPYVALQPTFLPTDSATCTTPLAPPNSAPPPVSPALTTATPVPAAAVVAATTTDALAAVAQPVPLANNPVPNSGPGVATTPATITIAPTQNLLQPSLVMSDQNLQWILSSAANSQQSPDQAVSTAFT